MYTIYIALDLPNIPQEKQDSMLSQHRAWFKKYFDEGVFLMVGPCPDVPGTGLIIAQGTKEEMEEIIKSDVYYADQLATYDIREFQVRLFNDRLKDYVE